MANKPGGQEKVGVFDPISYATFGHVGNSEAGEAFNRTESPNTTLRIDDTGTYTYIGKAIPGASETDPEWQIKRVTNATSFILWAGGNAMYSNKWSERATPITYS